jgi:hypothetical protein
LELLLVNARHDQAPARPQDTLYVKLRWLWLPPRRALPHVYPLNTLCLFLGNREWHESIPIADTLVPWASEWLLYYELWLATGEWLGGGEHPPPGRHQPACSARQRTPRRLEASAAYLGATGRVWGPGRP